MNKEQRKQHAEQQRELARRRALLEEAGRLLGEAGTAKAQGRPYQALRMRAIAAFRALPADLQTSHAYMLRWA